MRTHQIAVVSTTVAANQGYRALADVADIAQGTNYRVIGGHMVQLLLHVYPTSNAHARLTADADAGVEQQVAAAGNLHGRAARSRVRSSAGQQLPTPGRR